MGPGAAGKRNIYKSVSYTHLQDSVPAEVKKNAKWKAFAAAAEKQGVVAAFPRKSAADIVRLLVTGAGRRGCTLSQDLSLIHI